MSHTPRHTWSDLLKAYAADAAPLVFAAQTGPSESSRLLSWPLTAPDFPRLQALKRLGELDPFLSWIDSAWLSVEPGLGGQDAPNARTESGLDWHWHPGLEGGEVACFRPDASDGSPRLAVAWMDNGCVAIVDLPGSMARRLLRLPFHAVGHVLWRPVPAVLVVAGLTLSAQEIAQLEPGGLLLLEDSFRPAGCDSWSGELWVQGESAPLSVDLTSPYEPRLCPVRQGTRLLDNPPDDGVTRCRVRLDPPVELDPVGLFELFERETSGWAAAASAEVARIRLDLRSLRFRLDMDDGTPSSSSAERVLAQGRLTPWGDGWALAIESVPMHVAGPSIEKG